MAMDELSITWTQLYTNLYDMEILTMFKVCYINVSYFCWSRKRVDSGLIFSRSKKGNSESRRIPTLAFAVRHRFSRV